MEFKKLELFNSIVLLSNKKINKDILRLDNVELVLNHLRQNALLISQAKKKLVKWSKSRVVICISDPYLTDLAIFVKQQLFDLNLEVSDVYKLDYEINIMESKDFYMKIPQDVKMVIFIGELEKKYIRYCLANEILLVSVFSSVAIINKRDVYYLPIQIDNLAVLIWFLLLLKNANTNET